MLYDLKIGFEVRQGTDHLCRLLRRSHANQAIHNRGHLEIILSDVRLSAVNHSALASNKAHIKYSTATATNTKEIK